MPPVALSRALPAQRTGSPIRNIRPSSQPIKFGYPATVWQQKRGFWRHYRYSK